MSTSTSSYSSMLGGMWAPEGSDINERLKRLQELEQMRKEREAQRQAKLKNMGKGVKIVRTARINSSDPESNTSSGFRYRRTMSLQDEDADNYGGARPKMGGFSTYGQEDKENPASMFSSITASIFGSRKPLRGDYSTRRRLGSGDSDDSTTSSTYSKPTYEYTTPNFSESSYSYSKPEGDTNKNFFSGITSSLRQRPGYGSSYTSRVEYEPQRVEARQNGLVDDYSNGQESNEFENGEHNENNEDENNEDEDHGEEPKHFIERLKYGNGNYQSEVNNTNTHIHSIPAVPPFRERDFENEGKEVHNEDMPDLVQPTDDILSVAHEISTTFGNLKSPTYLTPKKNNQKNIEQKTPYYDGNTDPNVSVTYEIQTVDYDSSGDEAGKVLPVRESMYQASTSEWNVLDQTPGKLDQMQEFFTGEAPGEDPNISRELDGEKVKAELEKSFSNVQTPKSSRNYGNKTPKTPTSMKRIAQKDTKVNRSKSPLDKLKSSESENDSVATSESENDTIGNRSTTPRKTATPSSARKSEKNGMSLSDKLAKLESLTQEKKRKHSVGENEVKKPLPSYMTATSASQKKKARGKDASPKPSRDLKKDVRELKQFVHEHASEPNTPATSPTKQFTEFEFTNKERKTTREMSVQTEFILDFPDINYVCKHCGKSSFDEVQSQLLTEENLNKALGQKTKRGSPENEKTKPGENKSSKDSVKSFGETSTKSERSYRYKPKPVTGTQSYMKGTTSSRLRNNANNVSNTDGKARKGSAPEIVHRAELESAKGTSSLKGIVSQKTKAIESSSKREKTKPALSLFRGNSVERNKPEPFHKTSHLSKSKSVDQVHFINNELEKEADNSEPEKQIKETKTKQNEILPLNIAPLSPGANRSRTPMKQKAPSPPKVAPKPQKPQAVEKLDLSSLDTPGSPMSPRSPMSLKKPPLASPRGKDTEISPRSEISNAIDDDNKSVESKGQFTTIDDNPFIKNDTRRRNSLRGHDKSESVWEKAESRSRDSSLKRSNSTSEGDRGRLGSGSSLKRHNTSAGEKSSVSELTWSDSGSTGSLRGSKSSLHGSNTSLNREGNSAFHRPRAVSTSSTTSQTSQNAMLNLLSPIGTTRHPVSGAMETDVDAAYEDHTSEQKFEEHDEESVNRAHLDFAKKACDMLEFELKKRDSSNESDKDKGKTEDNKENNNNFKSINGEDTGSLLNGTGSGKKEKGKKGFRKLFKK